MGRNSDRNPRTNQGVAAPDLGTAPQKISAAAKYRNIVTSQYRNLAISHGRNIATSPQRPGFCRSRQFFFGPPGGAGQSWRHGLFGPPVWGGQICSGRRMARWAPTREPVRVNMRTNQGVAAPDLGTAPQEISPAATRRGSDLRTGD